MSSQVVRELDRFPCYACGRQCSVARAIDGSGDMVLHAEPPCDVFEHSDPDAFALYCYQKARGSAQA